MPATSPTVAEKGLIVQGGKDFADIAAAQVGRLLDEADGIAQRLPVAYLPLLARARRHAANARRELEAAGRWFEQIANTEATNQ